MSDIQLVPLSKIVFNRFQQSDARNEPKVLEIVSSIHQHRDNGTKGLLQVPTARYLADDTYELAFGHHRFMAFQIAAAADTFFSDMPLIVRDLSDIDMFELMAIENFHRRDISPIEEAKTFHAYMETFQKTSVETAQKFEKTDEYVRASIRLLNLPAPAQQMVTDGKINKTIARDLLVLEKLGGAHLVEMGIDEIEGDDFENPTVALKSFLNRGIFTKWLDDDADWFKANKNFPRKHLPTLTAKDLEEIVKFAEGYGDGVPALLIKDVLKLVASGMEVTDEAFPQLDPTGLQRVRVLANPTPCEKCPLHAVLDGNHYCGLPLCKERKESAWKKKELDDIASHVGVPLYRKEDGPFITLSHYNDKDKKLWKDGSPDLRLREAKYQYNNFDGLNSTDLAVVVVGDTYEKRKAAEEKGAARAESQAENTAAERELEGNISSAKSEAILKFTWEVGSRMFATMLEGITSFELMKFWYDNNPSPDFPDNVDEEELFNAMNDLKKADQLKQMRRLMALSVLDRYLYSNDQYQVEDKDKKPVIKHAANLKDIAGIFDVKLPKEFDEQAETYQNDLDVMIKGLTADAKPSKAKK